MCKMCNAPEHKDITEEQRKAICAAETQRTRKEARRKAITAERRA